MMLKITLSLLTMATLATASDYSRANSASADALRGLDCEFEDCSPKFSKPVEPKVIVKEKVVYRDRPVEKIVYKDRPVEVEKIVVKEKVVYRDRPKPTTVVAPEEIPAPAQADKRVYDAVFDIPIIGVTGSSFQYYYHHFYVDDDRVKVRKPSNNKYLKTQSRASWAAMTLKNGKSLFLSKYDNTIPFFKYSMTQMNFHVELPAKVISNDKTVVALPKMSYKNDAGYAEEYSTCSFNGFVPSQNILQKEVSLHGNKYLDVKCTVLLWDYNLARTDANSEIQSMVESESFEFIPIYRVYPPVRKGTKKAVLGSTLRKFVFAKDIVD